VSLGVRGEKRLNTTAVDRSAIETGVAHIRGMNNAHKVLAGKLVAKRPLGKPGSR
jgi:hypothetical protein